MYINVRILIIFIEFCFNAFQTYRRKLNSSKAEFVFSFLSSQFINFYKTFWVSVRWIYIFHFMYTRTWISAMSGHLSMWSTLQNFWESQSLVNRKNKGPRRNSRRVHEALCINSAARVTKADKITPKQKACNW